MMEQSSRTRGNRIPVGRSSDPRPFGQYTYDRGMVEALKRVEEAKPAPSYGDRFKK